MDSTDNLSTIIVKDHRILEETINTGNILKSCSHKVSSKVMMKILKMVLLGL